LFVEGKRTEPLSSSTNWFPARNQLVRNLEVIGDIAGRRAPAVLLATETPIPEIDEAVIAASTPHLDSRSRVELQSRYLGQLTWQTLCSALDIDFGSLPDQV
jgi:hypothetical protein